ncbi:aminodeoxychorismate lyase [Marinomonas sp. A79]|uniref:Aminodeoxychorismate lyase n=1 Tax=Marinomonas vulgaris TaxID=2823372 RepID=A0ABS5HFX8_9GAMM|nr:aminodeoxychorismate lyase [Marinomonas vulgaris]MBR7889934.1 aminodeoxychorismate lyase [Marinomonas vulgaris]
MTWFVNYQRESQLSITDRGFAYGDGLFETIRTSSQCFFQLDDHLSRLFRGLKKLGMPFTLDQKQHLTHFLYETVLPFIHQDSVVKIMVSRGSGGRGYLPPEHCEHSIVIGILPAPDYSAQAKKGVSLSISPVPVNQNRFLAGIKHMNRLENVMAKRYLTSPDFEAVMLDGNGNVIECIQSNIFWFRQGVLCTPSLSQAGVQGTYRSGILSRQSHYLTHVSDFSIKALLSADEVFISNSLMGIVPVTRIEKTTFPIGVHTLTLQKIMQDKDKHGVV